jgi:hypothetical protein
MSLTVAYLRSILHYNKRTGIFTWRVTKRCVCIGMIAGCITHKKYIRIQINGRPYMAHRLAWLYVTGSWPKEEIDHKDCNGINNKWKNLRQANRTQQCQNTRIFLKGVRKSKRNLKKPWRVTIQANYKIYNLGSFSTIAEAKAIYAAAAKRLHGEFARIE